MTQGSIITNQNINSLEPGVYSVTVDDGNSCVDSLTNIIISDYEAADVNFTLSEDDLNPEYNISCFGGSDGTIDVTVTGGSDSYLFNWTGFDSDGNIIYSSNSEDISNLSAGNYSLVVTSFDYK